MQHMKEANAKPSFISFVAALVVLPLLALTRLLLALIAIGRRLRPQAGATGFPDGDKLAQQPVQEIDTLFNTANGLVATLQDGRVMAVVAGKCQLFNSVLEYRNLFDDHGSWDEIEDSEEMRKFVRAQSASVQDRYGVSLRERSRPRRKVTLRDEDYIG